MKTMLLASVAILLTASCVLGQEPPSVVEKGWHHRVWQGTVQTGRTNQQGNPIILTNSYTELETGMYYKDGNGAWQEAQASIQEHPNGAVAQQGQHQVIFASDITDQDGAVDLQTRDGKRLISSVMGLSYWDSSTDQSVLIAEVRSSEAVIDVPNQLYYLDAFTDLKADVRYTYRKSGLEQDIIFLERFPIPSDYGLSNATTKLQVLTEFYGEPPVPAKRTGMKNGLQVDHVLDFGEMKIYPGRAFITDDGVAQSPTIVVDKHWTILEERTFLIEEVDYSAIEGNLSQLPLPPGVMLHPVPKDGSRIHRVAKKQTLPEKRQAVTKQRKKVRTASVTPHEKSFVLDYTIVSGAANFTFKSDTTYLVTNAVILTGTTIIEGGTVVKFTNGAAKITMDTNIWRTGPYRPAVFTSMHNNSVGETITGSTGNPWTNYTGNGIELAPGSALKYARFSFLNNGLTLVGLGVFNTGNDLQFIRCRDAVFLDDGGAPGALSLDNALFYQCTNVFTGLDQAIVVARNVTANQCRWFNSSTDASLFLTNCLLVNVTNFSSTSYSVQSNSTVNLSGASGDAAFQSVGGANHYLASESTYRNYGTTNIPATLLTALATKTTYPPLVYSNAFTINTLLEPQAQRDFDVPDLGYHYDPLDYCIGNGVSLSGVTLSLTNGVAVGFYVEGIVDPPANLMMGNGAKVISQGTPLYPNHLVWYNTSQEQSSTNWASSDYMEIIASWDYSGSPVEVQCRFTDYSVLAGGASFIGTGDIGFGGAVSCKDSQFRGGTWWCDSPYPDAYSTSINITNCVFERMNFRCRDGQTSFTAYNNLFYHGSLTLENEDTNYLSSFTFRDNQFYSNSIVQSGNISVTHDHNAYMTNCDRLGTGTGDVILTNFTFLTGPLSDFYQPPNSPLLDVGSRNSTNAGLYHFTVLTNQVKETNTVVDIGAHWVAISNSVPVDTDGDGFADHIEDANGNGTLESGETQWNNVADYLGLKVWITRPRGNSNLP